MKIAFFWEASESKPQRHINYVAESAKMKKKKREM